MRPEGSTADEDFEREALANWKLGTETAQEQLDREIEDLKFQVPELQWSEQARNERKGTSVGGIAIPARPCLAVPKTEQPIRIVLNQMQAAHLGVNIHPISEDAEDDTAEVMQDLYRTIERDSNAQQARYWAYDRSTRAGRGWYRVNTQYDDQSDNDFDQKITIERILYQSAVVMDPSATKADCSDAQWAFLTAWVPLEQFKRRWPKANLTELVEGSDGLQLTPEAICKQTPEWVRMDGDKRSIQVAEYWCKHYKSEPIESKDGKKKRSRDKVKLMWYILAPGGDGGLEVVEETEWNGPDIPLIPSIGNELQPFDEKRRIFGMYRPMRDSAQIFNYAATTLVERTAMEPKAPFVVDIKQVEGFEDIWKQANTRNFPYLPYNRSIDGGGQQSPPPGRVEVNTSAMGPSVLLLQQADEFIQSASATPDPVLGKGNTKNQSGKAIAALQGQSEASTSNYLGNFAQITLMYEAKVVLGMMKRVYDRPGRIARLVNIQGDVRPVMLNAPFTMDMNTGRPKRVVQPPQIPGMSASMPPGMPGAPSGTAQTKPKYYDLTKGIYGVSVTVGKSFQTRLEQGSEQIGQFMEQDPELAVILAPLFLKYQDWPGSKEAADLAKEYRDKKFPGIGTPKDGLESPEQLQAKLKAAENQMQQMQQAGAELQKQLETEQLKNQTILEKAKMDADKTLQKTSMDNETRIIVAQIAAAAKENESKLNAIMSVMLDKSKAAQAESDRRQALALDDEGKAHELGMAAVQQGAAEQQALTDQDYGREMSEREYEQSLEAQQMAADAAGEAGAE